MADVIKSFVLVNKATGQAISPYGVLPYGTAEDWDRVDRGWTIQWPDGSVGNGRAPFDTKEAAEAYALKNKSFPGMIRFTD